MSLCAVQSQALEVTNLRIVYDRLLHDGAYLHFPFRKHDDESELVVGLYEPKNTRVCEAIVGQATRLRCDGSVDL
jgi:hypothetical protein